MPYRTCSKFHKIRYAKKGKEWDNFSITITREAALSFSGCVLFEKINENSIELMKSGCDIFEKDSGLIKKIRPENKYFKNL